MRLISVLRFSDYRFSDYAGFDSNIFLILRDGIIMSIGNFPEMLSTQILVGIILLSKEIGRASRPDLRVENPNDSGTRVKKFRGFPVWGKLACSK